MVRLIGTTGIWYFTVIDPPNYITIILIRRNMKPLYQYSTFIFFFSLFLISLSCEEDDMDSMLTGEGPQITGLTVTPQADVLYGDELSLTASLHHEPGLYAYFIQISSGSEVLFDKIQLLTGKSFEVEEVITLPLPHNASSGDLKISLTVKDYDDNSRTEEITVSNVQVPVFEQLYLILDNNKVYPMTGENDHFVVKDFIPANATGKIYASPDKKGMSWGLTDGKVAPLGRNNITFGKDSEAFFEISFDPYTFELVIGGAEVWVAIGESLYILGGISGHWADGVISTERSKMKMTGYRSGDEKYWTWSPPNDGTGSPETDMWGSIVAGSFRLKLAGENQFITYANQMITLGSDDVNSAFEVSVGGSFTIKVFQEGEHFTRVSLEDATRTLEYTSEGIFINGIPVPDAISFGGHEVGKVDGSYFTFE